MRVYWDGEFMSADKKPKKRSADITLSGKVIEKLFGKGTKSEHEACYLKTDHEEYKLRRIGGNPFFDPVLQVYLGKNVICRGIIDKKTFLAREIKEDTR